MGSVNNIPALAQIMAWRRPLSEPTIVSLLMHTCVTRPQWVNRDFIYYVADHTGARWYFGTLLGCQGFPAVVDMEIMYEVMWPVWNHVTTVKSCDHSRTPDLLFLWSLSVIDFFFCRLFSTCNLFTRGLVYWQSLFSLLSVPKMNKLQWIGLLSRLDLI